MLNALKSRVKPTVAEAAAEKNMPDAAGRSLESRRQIGSISSLVATVVAFIVNLTSGAASAEEKILLEPLTDPENLVEWFSARSPNWLRYELSEDRRTIRISTTVNSPVFVDGGCPSADDGTWKLAGTTYDLATHTGRTHAEKDDAAVERTGENGTFTLRFTAPSRDGQTFTTKFNCTETGEGGDKEPLILEVTAVGDGNAPGGSGTQSRSTAEEKSTRSVHAYGAFAFSAPTSDPTDLSAGCLAVFAKDPIHKGGAGNWPIEAVYSLGTVAREEGEYAGRHHFAGIGAAWNPELWTEYARFRAGAAVGPFVKEAITEDGEETPGETGVGGRFYGQFEGGFSGWGLVLGADVIVNSTKAPTSWGPYAGVYGRFF